MTTYTSEYPIISVTVDLALFRVNPEDHFHHQVLLVERGNEPYKGQWALPGGFLNHDEFSAEAAKRECREETGVEPSWIKFVTMLDSPDRDPRGRTISYLFTGWLGSSVEPVAGDDAAQARWVDLAEARRGPLAFDHDYALSMAWKALQ